MWDSHDQSSSTTTNLQICFVCDLSILAPGQTTKDPSTQGFRPTPSIFGKPMLNEESIISSVSPFLDFFLLFQI